MDPQAAGIFTRYHLTTVYLLRKNHPQTLDTEPSTDDTEGVEVNTHRRWPKGTWMKLQSPETQRALMNQRGFSYDRLARYAGVSKSFISHLTAGRKTTCKATTAENIAEALDIPLEILFVPSISADCGPTIRTGQTHRAVA